MRRVLPLFPLGLLPLTAAASPDPEALDSPKFHALLALGAHSRGSAGEARQTES